MLGIISKAAGLITGAATSTASNLARFTGYTASALSALAAPAATASAAEIAALSAKQFASGANAVVSSVDNFAGAVMPAVGQAFDSSARMAQLVTEMSFEGIENGRQIFANTTEAVTAGVGFTTHHVMQEGFNIQGGLNAVGFGGGGGGASAWQQSLAGGSHVQAGSQPPPVQSPPR